MDTPFDTLMASVDPPLVVVTTAAEGVLAGCVVGFHCQSGIEGNGYSIWLSKANHTYRTSLRSSHFAVHFLSQDDMALAERFGTQSGEDTDKFEGLDVTLDEFGVPFVTSHPRRLLLDRIAVLDDGSDHVCITTRVRDAVAAAPFTPLRVSDVDHLDEGRPAEERAVSP